ncbi:pyruvate dehydrogenase E2 component (dihydrolipoamide acetyltransferase) [Aliiroseovarius crassostreae]|uniref:Acetyltransferase component of pyruvate dehydrogenase complex n=1 Tax=Aliiroseovarius crassostreae TaxID=154981 RepID=A0A0P7IUW0_9RHOB|nr:pyruvate dehydrogenase complex dihydrolipoamide acetyltransferase [Aliiroseovarius crassostreae]KPN62804.1 branched-chain alpha-keto acid dehydrogenase subunit E2 [Aliiroseovarius crassostreae]SFU71035.1 pyruvate dehydrogenase E2 component (dihydrolipoamide acetyltransferase) [Aliiroseovarius crassostreae]
MPKEIILPSLSAGMEDAVIATWLKAEGEAVTAGEALAEVETDKATMEFEAEADGVIGKILVPAGARADVNAVIAVLLLDGEDASALDGYAPGGTAPAAGVEVQTDAPSTETPKAAQPAKAAVSAPASPLARRIAAQKGVDLSGLTGSGPRGRIVRIDVERAAAVGTTAPPVATPEPATAPTNLAGIGDYEAIPHTGMRRTIARRLLTSKTTVPHFYLEADCDIEALLALRTQINEDREKADRISVNDFIVKAVAKALAKVPAANAIWTEDAVLQLKSIDISVAVATEGGLITPVLRGADQKSLGALSAEMKALAAKARDGRLKPEDYQGGGFSLSNLGMYGVKSFSAIINPPQSCILAVGAAERRPVGRGDQIVLAPVMSVTLSVDHRSVDGAVGAEWLAAFKAGIEAPMSLLV